MAGFVRWFLVVFALAIGGTAFQSGLPSTQAQTPHTGSDWIRDTIGEVQFSAPSDWTRERLSEGALLLLTSPDGQRTLWVSWWFPDEPLLGYDDIISHRQIMIDGRPALLIHSRIGTTESISVTLDQPRADGHRLQFLYEYPGDLSHGDPVLDAILASVTHGSASTASDQPEPETPEPETFLPTPPVSSAPSGILAEDIADPLSSDGPFTGQQWTRYVNARFGTSVEYPADIFSPLPPPDNNDGRSFETAAANASFLVFAGHNALAQSVPERLAEQIAAGLETIERAELHPDGFHLEGRSGEDFIVHIEKFDDADVVHTLKITYPADMEQDLGSLVTRMVRSFSVEKPEPESPSQATRPVQGDTAIELAFWQAIAQSDDPADFEAYLAQWPDGAFAALARNRLRRLERPVEIPAPRSLIAPGPEGSSRLFPGEVDRIWLEEVSFEPPENWSIARNEEQRFVSATSPDGEAELIAAFWAQTMPMPSEGLTAVEHDILGPHPLTRLLLRDGESEAVHLFFNAYRPDRSRLSILLRTTDGPVTDYLPLFDLVLMSLEFWRHPHAGKLNIPPAAVSDGDPFAGLDMSILERPPS